MTSLQAKFIEENKTLDIQFHSDKNFFIIKKCDFNKGSRLCAKYGASGFSCGKSFDDFMIGNFGKYKK